MLLDRQIQLFFAWKFECSIYEDLACVKNDFPDSQGNAYFVIYRIKNLT